MNRDIMKKRRYLEVAPLANQATGHKLQAVTDNEYDKRKRRWILFYSLYMLKTFEPRHLFRQPIANKLEHIVVDHVCNRLCRKDNVKCYVVRFPNIHLNDFERRYGLSIYARKITRTKKLHSDVNIVGDDLAPDEFIRINVLTEFHKKRTFVA